MKNKLKTDNSFIVVSLVSVLIIIDSLRMEHFKSKMLPLILAGAVLILSVIGYWQKIKDQRKKQEAAVPEAEKEKKADKAGGSALRAQTVALAWIAGYMAGIYLLGLVAAIPVFVFTYMKAHGIRLPVTIFWTILCTVATYLVFEVLLEVELYRGVLMPYLLQ